MRIPRMWTAAVARQSGALALIALLGTATVALWGCSGGKAAKPYSIALGGSPHSGRQVIAEYKCGSCHTIPGIPHAHGVFGPPLNFIARRSILAGNFPNTPANLERWVMAPKSMKPGTAMPDLGLDQQQARDVAAYLETLQ